MTTIMQLGVITPLLFKHRLGMCDLTLDEARRIGNLSSADFFMVLALLIVSSFLTFCYASLKVRDYLEREINKTNSIVYRVFSNHLKLGM